MPAAFAETALANQFWSPVAPPDQPQILKHVRNLSCAVALDTSDHRHLVQDLCMPAIKINLQATDSALIKRFNIRRIIAGPLSCGKKAIGASASVTSQMRC